MAAPLSILLRRSIPLVLFLFLPALSSATTLTRDTVWEGRMALAEDLLVPKGITLTVRAGTTVTVVAAESTKTDPEFLSPLTEITVRGTIKVEGTTQAPVLFSGREPRPGSWAGIIIDSGSADLHHLTIKDAETGLHLLNGTLHVTSATLRENRYGLILQGLGSNADLTDSRILGNDYGVFTLQGGRLTTHGTTVAGNRKRDTYSASAPAIPAVEKPADVVRPLTRRYGDEVFRGDTLWRGRIEVAGKVRVPEGGRLIILPGTVVEFTRKDTVGGGVGENGILIQGRLIAKGTREEPIVFRSAEKVRQRGDWDAINIMNSSAGQNLIEHCRIEDAYRGLHFHFSNVAVRNTLLTNNYRAIQFQESFVELTDNRLVGNYSGLQGRNSDVTLAGNLIAGNFQGANFLRSNLTARKNRISGNGKEGLRVREGVASVQENLIDGNRQGLQIADTFFGNYSRNSIAGNTEVGLSLKNVDNVEVVDNFISANGITGVNVQESRAVIKGNQISDNGDRGVGVLSFFGVITENNLVANGRYAIDLDGPGDVAAPSNWWGGDEPRRVILDRAAEAARGWVDIGTPAAASHRFPWPLEEIPLDTTWRGTIAVGKQTTVLPGALLTVMPGTTVEFARGAGLAIRGKLSARGRPDARITFTSVDKKGPADWEEVILEYATGSIVSHCVFENATWGLHSHFTNLAVSDSLFRNNFGGMRFRSGPVEIARSRFEGNTIGIRAYLGNATINNNVIRNNETGIFVREKGGGLKIVENDIYDNSNYNVRVGDFNTEDVNARNNWWGDATPVNTFFDGRNEPGIGMVIFEPFRTEPVNQEGRAR